MLLNKSLGRRGAMLLGLAGLAGAVAGVYVSLGLYGKEPALAAQCEGAAALARQIDPFAKGEVAAFRPAANPTPLADLAFLDPNGEPMTLGDFSGRTVLVNLWATWCAPCRTEMPALDRLEAALGDESFEVVAVNIDLNQTERAKAFLDEINVTHLAFYSDPSARVFPKLKGQGLALGLPTTLLIDGEGCRVGSMEGPAEWDSEDAKALIAAALNPPAE